MLGFGIRTNTTLKLLGGSHIICAIWAVHLIVLIYYHSIIYLEITAYLKYSGRGEVYTPLVAGAHYAVCL